VNCRDPLYFTGLDPPRDSGSATAVAEGQVAGPNGPVDPEAVDRFISKAPDSHSAANALVEPGPSNKVEDPQIPQSPTALPVMAPEKQPSPTPAPGKPENLPVEPDTKMTSPDPKYIPEVQNGPGLLNANPTQEKPPFQNFPVGNPPVQVNPSPTPDLQFGVGKGQADPHNLNNNQLAAISQALAAARSPATPIEAVQPGQPNQPNPPTETVQPIQPNQPVQPVNLATNILTHQKKSFLPHLPMLHSEAAHTRYPRLQLSLFHLLVEIPSYFCQEATTK